MTLSIGSGSTNAKTQRLVVGGPPRVDLLPPEVRQGKKDAAVRRQLFIGVIAIGLLVVIGYVAATGVALDSQSKLTSAQDQTTNLLAQQNEYSAVRQLSVDIDNLTVVRQIGTAREINFKSFLADVADTMPQGMSISQFDADIASPVEVAEQAETPLQGPRVGSMVFDVSTPTLQHVGVWMSKLRFVTGYVDAQLGDVSVNEESGKLEFQLTVHVDSAAFSGRYADPVDPDAGEGETATEGDAATEEETE